MMERSGRRDHSFETQSEIEWMQRGCLLICCIILKQVGLELLPETFIGLLDRALSGSEAIEVFTSGDALRFNILGFA